ncbi:hypothetical protein DFH09DRAFT_1280758 [Mycena vulgaris]|nr:hypothetical protein DFH09DRAFT_1280758 [Mycena vulgaris]
MTTDHPPAFEPSTIDLQSVTNSKIVSSPACTSSPSTRPESSEYFRSPELPRNGVSPGRGTRRSDDVTVSVATGTYAAMTSLKLGELLVKREKTANALARCQKALASLEQYLGSLPVQHLEVSKLENMLESYEASGERLDAKKSELTQELRTVETAIAVERAQITAPHENDRLRTKAAIGVFAQVAGDVEIALIYDTALKCCPLFPSLKSSLAAVPAATWTAFYDIRVDTDTKENPVKLIYKAAVRQKTGESWDDVPLQLETSTPTFCLQELRIVETAIAVERAQITAPHENDRLRTKAAIGVFAQAVGDVEIALIYGAALNCFPLFPFLKRRGRTGIEVEALGLDRKVNWICAVPAQGKINLALEWEVTVSPASAQVVGL